MPLTQQQKMELYHRRRAELIEQLGGKCAKCGSTDKLEFDHWPRACTWAHNKKNPWQRMKIYMEEAAKGMIRLLCRRCNRKQGDPDTSFDPRDYEST